MGRKPSTGQLRVWFLTTIASTSAPTTAEITAGTDLTPFLRRDGLNTPLSGNTVPTGNVASPFNTTVAGTVGGDAPTLSAYRDDTAADDDAWSTLAPVSSSLPDGTEGFLVIRRFGGSTTAAAASDVVEVWPVSAISREPAQIAENEAQYFTVTFAVTSEPVMDATVSAGTG